MKREDYYLPNGILVDRIYCPPEGYALIGTGRVTQADVIRELFRREQRHIAANREQLGAPSDPGLRLVGS